MRPLRDYIRAINYLMNYIFLEKPRGLDFSLRDLSEISEAQQHGYAMTSDKAIRNIARIIDFSGKSFLDIGSGKGRVPYQAYKLGAKNSEGIEFSEKFHIIAKRNYDILGVSDNCKSNHIDATKFKRYNEFDIFFLFNPFEDELYEEVIDTLFKQVKARQKKRFIICYGGANLSCIRKFDFVEQVHEGVCPHRGNRIAIFCF